jgi:hypothetical protein
MRLKEDESVDEKGATILLKMTHVYVEIISQEIDQR